LVPRRSELLHSVPGSKDFSLSNKVRWKIHHLAK
jgi:hypothetical protein